MMPPFLLRPPATGGPMSAIFISHSSADNAWAEQIATWLKSQGYESLFLDFDPDAGLQAGEMWRQTIFRQLRQSQAVLALCSANFLASQWCLSEVAIASGLCKHLFPLLIGPGELPKLLQETQAINFQQDAAEGYRRLALGLDQRLKWRDRLRWASDRPPYPGLMACQEEDGAVFFGRDPETDEVLRRLRGLRQAGRGLLVVLGASGCGKSSLLRAGLLPQLRLEPASWLVLEPFRPGDDPFAELGDVLGRAFRTLGEPPPEPPRDAEALRPLLRRLRQAGGQREACVVVSIDQLEELLHGDGAAPAGNNRGGADGFLRFLSESVAAAEGRLLVLATLRSDFLNALQLHPADLGRQADQFLLGPMGQEGIQQVIEGPAARVGLTLEPGLSLRMAEDTGSGDALPLLAFTLRDLWDAHGGDGALSLRDYRSLGGLEQAVERAANDALRVERLSDGDRRALRQAFIPAMVRLTEQGTFTRRAARWEALPVAAQPLLADLVNRRLLVRRGEGGEQTVEVAHEALLRRWPLLSQWLEEERDFLKGFEQIKRDHRQWKEASPLDRSELLLPKGKLDKASRWQRDHPQAFEGDLARFLEASARHQRASGRRVRTFASLFLLSLLLTGYGLIRMSPRLSARILVPLAAMTGNEPLISGALAALREHRRGLLAADGGKDDASQRMFRLHCSAASTEPFCVSERQTMRLLELKTAPYSLNAVAERLAEGDIGRWSPGSSKSHTKRYTEGALKQTAYLFFDSHAVGADLNMDGEINSPGEAWLIPCELLRKVDQLWTRLPPRKPPRGEGPSCRLFPENPNESDYSDPKCDIIADRQQGSLREKRSLAFWLFDPEQRFVYDRYAFCKS